MLKYLIRNISNTLVTICLLLPLNDGYGADGKAANPVDNSPSMNFTGEWKTKDGSSPGISIVFSEERNRNHQIRINGRLVDMTGGRLPKPSFPAFFHFTNLNWNGPYGGESYKDLGLINGVINSKEVLSGFYSETDHDSDDRIMRGFSVPVVLYPVKSGKK